jgi:hypothetical protein
MVEPVVVILVDERRSAVTVGDRPSGVGGATRGGLQVRQQYAESERRHRADHDPEEERRAARPWGLIAEHEKSVSGCVAPALLSTATIGTSQSIGWQAFELSHLLVEPSVHARYSGLSTALTDGVNIRCICSEMS